MINDSQNPHNVLKDLRTKNLDRVIIGHLNINSIRNKFDYFKDITHRIDFLINTINILYIGKKLSIDKEFGFFVKDKNKN